MLGSNMKRADCGLLYDLYHDIEFHFQFTDVFVSLKQLHFESTDLSSLINLA